MTDNADVFKVLARADGRWASKQADDPADPEYLRHLAAALQPLIGEAAPEPVDAGEVEQWRTRAAEYLTGAEQARAELVAVRDEHTRLAQANGQLEATNHRVAGLLADATRALEAARAARDTATNQLRVTQADLADTLALLALLGRLVDTVTTQWQPQGDIPAQVARAIDLVNAASDQLNARHDAGRHVHQYPQLPNSRYGSCECGKPYPRTAKAGLAGATKGGA